MARPLRIEFPGAYYHITSRGNERHKIFNDSHDRERFLSYVGSAYDRFGAVIYCFCLMDNHYHLLLQTPSGNLSQIMHYINASYTGYFNRKHRRSGHLFQGRYKGILVEPDSYAMELSRYIHLNPVRAETVKKAEEYLWSSYRYYLDASEKPEWLNTDLILSHFGNVKSQGIQQYHIFIEEAVGKKYESPLKQAVGSVLLGGEKFIHEIKEKYLKEAELSRDIPSIRSLKPVRSMEDIVRLIEKESGVIDKKLLKKIIYAYPQSLSYQYYKEYFSRYCFATLGNPYTTIF